MLLLRLTGQNTPVGAAATEYTETFQRFCAAVEDDYARARDVGHYAHSLGYQSCPRALRPSGRRCIGSDLLGGLSDVYFLCCRRVRTKPVGRSPPGSPRP
ncbi:hypothetical protein GCM10007147_05500 [Nocardiopsis kunsanensis]|uniref:Uncharacterized protein n=1 Tax=Nocardiopsis kunsanensis TaxID=141693 RepID=A0A918X8V7_9ACTN|nr:hypothetical protein GCM10007147_05500 [Nocardiopsis kunsanensis]